MVDDDSDGGCGEERDQTDALVIDSSETDTAAEVTKTTEESSNDLASVSRLIKIDNPMKDFFGKKQGDGFGEDREKVEGGVMDLVKDEEGGEAEGVEEDGDDGDDGDDEGESGNPSNSSRKATSAYSAAPHKIPCPHCDRKFPWQSSLNRHILTHTGSKPYR